MEPRYDDQGRHLCSAHRRDGEMCRAPAIKGHFVCNKHGGQLPSVKEAARRRLLEAVDPLMAELLKIALGDDDTRVRLAAIRDALDRAGLVAVKHVEGVSLEAIDAEIQRLEAELGVNDEETDVS